MDNFNILVYVDRTDCGGIMAAAERICDDYDGVRIRYVVGEGDICRESDKDSEKLGIVTARELRRAISGSYFILTDKEEIARQARGLLKPVLFASRRGTDRGAYSVRPVGRLEGPVYRGMRALLEEPALYYSMCRA